MYSQVNFQFTHQVVIILPPTGCEDMGVLVIGVIPVAILPFGQDMKNIVIA